MADETTIRIEYAALGEVVRWPRNPKDHDLPALRRSVGRFGFVNPLLVDERTGQLVAGHGRLDALQEMKEAGQAPPERIVARDDDWYVPVVRGVRFNSDQEAEAYLVADNRLTELGGWDDAALAALLADLDDEELVEAAGFSDDELAALLEEIGDEIAGEDNERLSLVDRFIVPPFSVLDARQGYWQDRKRAWLALGIESELGRGEVDRKEDGLTFTASAQGVTIYRLRNEMRTRRGYDPTWDEIIEEAERRGLQLLPGTSVFDPVLCELAYQWFCPPGGLVLDPFAGGSVRGIVAAILGRQYTGIDLSERQIEANRAQAQAIIEPLPTPSPTTPVRVSAKSARLKFHGCTPDYISNHCGAACCRSSKPNTGTMIPIHPSESGRIEALGGIVSEGFLVTEDRCTFQANDGLCTLHSSGEKPFGCIASPFTLTPKGTLIIRNRYKLLKCFRDGATPLPAYRAFEASLVHLFGNSTAQTIVRHLDDGGGDITVDMPTEKYNLLLDNNAALSGQPRETFMRPLHFPTWLVGDSRDLSGLVKDKVDFIFTCPPYFDLEVYSDAPADLSNAGTYEEFRETLQSIIAQAIELLKPDRFACIVVGDIRDRHGFYRNFVSDTVEAFLIAGARLYNEAVLINVAGSLPIRVRNYFQGSRKLGKSHQNVLVFCKGDPRIATEACGEIEILLPEGFE